MSIDNKTVPKTRRVNEQATVLADRRKRAEDIDDMLRDDEALAGVEAWLSRQELRVNLGARGPGFDVDTFVESSAGWLLRLVRDARARVR